MRKAIRDLEEEIAKANLFIEVRDSRIPYTSHNPDLLKLIPPGIKRLVVFNKMDLANEKKSLDIIKKMMETSKEHWMHVSTKQNVNVTKLQQFIAQNVTA